MRRAIRARRWPAGLARSTAVLPDFKSAHCVDVTTTVVRPVRPLSCVFLRPRQSRRRGVRHDLRFAPPTPPPAGNDGTPYYTEPAHATLSAAGTARRGADESTTRGARSVVGVCPPHGASRRLISTEGTCPHPTHPAPHRPPQDRMWCKSLRQRSWSARQTLGGFPRPQPPRLRPALRRGRQILSPFCRAQVTPQGVITAPAWRISVPGLSPGSAPEPPPTESSYARPQSRLAALMQAGGRGRRAAGGGGSYSPHTTRTPNARCGTCRTSPAWPLLDPMRYKSASMVLERVPIESTLRRPKNAKTELCHWAFLCVPVQMIRHECLRTGLTSVVAHFEPAQPARVFEKPADPEHWSWPCPNGRHPHCLFSMGNWS